MTVGRGLALEIGLLDTDIWRFKGVSRAATRRREFPPGCHAGCRSTFIVPKVCEDWWGGVAGEESARGEGSVRCHRGCKDLKDPNHSGLWRGALCVFLRETRRHWGIPGWRLIWSSLRFKRPSLTLGVQNWKQEDHLDNCRSPGERWWRPGLGCGVDRGGEWWLDLHMFARSH